MKPLFPYWLQKAFVTLAPFPPSSVRRHELCLWWDRESFVPAHAAPSRLQNQPGKIFPQLLQAPRHQCSTQNAPVQAGFHRAFLHQPCARRAPWPPGMRVAHRGIPGQIWFWFLPWWLLFAASSRHNDFCTQPYCSLVISEISGDLIFFCLLTAYSTSPIRKSEDKHKEKEIAPL